jgi:cytochrome P450
VLGKLTGAYFGVEDPIDYKLTTWSRDVSLHVFRECPTPEARRKGLSAGADFRGYVAQLVELVRARQLGHTAFNERLRAVVDTFDQLRDERGQPAFADDRELVSTLIGIVSGALATTASLFYQGLAAYAKQRPAQVFELPGTDSGPALLLAMQHKGLSVPDRIYRVCRNDTTLGDVPIAKGTLVVVGQGTALADNQGRHDDITFFGHGRHHCPAARLALAIIDGAALALAEQGPLTIEDADALTFSLSLTAR